MSDTIIIQMGSFNPLHRMHKRIADDAKSKYPGVHHCMCMAKKTCDKGENSDEEIERRAIAINEAGYEASMVDSGLFIDVIAGERMFNPGVKIIFPIGEDTLYRFFRDWDAYYSKEGTILPTRQQEYKNIFDNVEWYVSKRKCPESIMYYELTQQYLGYHNNVVWSDLDLDDISSSKIRAGEVVNE